MQDLVQCHVSVAGAKCACTSSNAVRAAMRCSGDDIKYLQLLVVVPALVKKSFYFTIVLLSDSAKDLIS